MSREFSGVKGWQGAAWLERQEREREREERTDLLLQALALTPGMVIADIGASLGTITDVGLPPNSVDLAIMVDVDHELSHPYEVLASIFRSLKPDGQVVFVEYKAENSQVPIKCLHKMIEAQVKREASVHFLRWVQTVAVLPWQHIVIFKKE